MLRGATTVRPQWLDLTEDAFSELVAGLRERERDVGMKALQALGGRRAADSEGERGAAVLAHRACGQHSPQLALPLGGVTEALLQRRLVTGGGRPAFDASRRFEPRHG